MITNTHLKKHNITVTEYKNKFGNNSTTSEEYRLNLSKKRSGGNNPNFGNKWDEKRKDELSNKLKGKIAWNRGESLSKSQKQNISKKMKEKYASGFKGRLGESLSDDSKNKISKNLKVYYDNNPEAKESLSEFAKTKSLNREKFNPFEDAVITKEGKIRQIEALKRANNKKRKEALEEIEKIFEKNQYTLVSYDHPVVTFLCNSGMKHEVTRQCFTQSKFKSNGSVCQFCSSKKSSDAEREIGEYIESLGFEVFYNDRKIITPKEIDIFVPEKNLAIEYCGLHWHSELMGKGKNYHKNKLIRAKEEDLELIHIFEHEWENKKELVLSMLKSRLGLSDRIFARKTTVKEISSSKANKFLNENHIQGSGRSNYRVGIFYKNSLFGVMTFSKGNLSRKLTEWEIDRMAFSLGKNIIGGASKMFKYFIKNINPKKVISYSDLRWGSGEVYSKLGFKLEKNTEPNYWYFMGSGKYIDYKHRFTLRKNYKPNIDDQNLTEVENRFSQGWNRIWDCGHNKWVYKRGD